MTRPSLADGQWRLEFRGCACPAPLLDRASVLEMLCQQCLRENDIDAAQVRFFQFLPRGSAGTAVMPQGRLALHTWPEQKLVSVFVSLTGTTSAQRFQVHSLLETLVAYFRPQETFCESQPSEPAKFEPLEALA
ncbi:MAG: S-adenosylmethionine decarboxylase [Pseudomonadota bacterium]